MPACLTNCLTFFAQSRSLALSLSLSADFALNLAAFSQRFYDVLMEPSANCAATEQSQINFNNIVSTQPLPLSVQRCDGARVQEWPQ